MNDVALIIDGVVAQVWRETSREALPVPEAGALTEFTKGLVVCGMLWDGEALSAPVIPEAPLPHEIPMHKARKALKQLGPNGAITPQTYGESWWMRVLATISTLENPIQRDSILDELDTAPNMVLAGASTEMIRLAIGMTDEQLEDVARLALDLP